MGENSKISLNFDLIGYVIHILSLKSKPSRSSIDQIYNGLKREALKLRIFSEMWEDDDVYNCKVIEIYHNILKYV